MSSRKISTLQTAIGLFTTLRSISGFSTICFRGALQNISLVRRRGSAVSSGPCTHGAEPRLSSFKELLARAESCMNPGKTISESGRNTGCECSMKKGGLLSCFVLIVEVSEPKSSELCSAAAKPIVTAVANSVRRDSARWKSLCVGKVSIGNGPARHQTEEVGRRTEFTD